MAEEPRRSAIVRVRITLGTNGEAFYTAIYANGEPGPRSEGYSGDTPAKARRAAIEAAVRDFPDAEIVNDG